MEYKKRVADSLLEQKLRRNGAVLIEGPKWCGKTTTAEQQASSILYMTDPSTMKQNLEMAKINIGQLLQGESPRLIDEWQVTPQFWDAIRFDVDHREGRGFYILTGSSVPPNPEDIVHSGAGRFGKLKMRTMSLWESGDSQGSVSLADLFDGKEISCATSASDILNIAYLICRGGWPGVLSLSQEDALGQAFDYYDVVVETDMARLYKTRRNPQRVRLLMRSYARHQGTQANISAIIKDMKVNESEELSDNTIYDYINALKDLFVIEDMPAWNPNLRSKAAIRTSDTRYFVDPSIATAALGLGPNDLINNLEYMGFLFETMCARDLRVYAEALDGNVYHYRDSDNQECDAVIHLRDGRYGLVEVKLGGDDRIEEGAMSLKKMYRKIDSTKMREPSFMMVLTGVGQYAYKRADGVYVVPVTLLKP